MILEEINVAILRAAYKKWHDTRGDAKIWLDILADKVDWGSLADGRPGIEFSKPRSSKEDVVGYFEELTSDWSMEYYLVNEYVAQGARVVALGETSWTNKKSGKTIAIPKVDVWLLEDGKVIQFMEHYDTHAVMMATLDRE